MFLVDDTGLELADACRCAAASAHIPLRSTPPSGAGSQVRATRYKKTYRSVRSGMFLVDDTGLEPVTLRTSSGCSYQLS